MALMPVQELPETAATVCAELVGQRKDAQCLHGHFLPTIDNRGDVAGPALDCDFQRLRNVLDAVTPGFLGLAPGGRIECRGVRGRWGGALIEPE
eukprot:4493713-Pyramimonas_sp.AAC.2